MSYSSLYSEMFEDTCQQLDKIAARISREPFWGESYAAKEAIGDLIRKYVPELGGDPRGVDKIMNNRSVFTKLKDSILGMDVEDAVLGYQSARRAGPKGTGKSSGSSGSDAALLGGGLLAGTAGTLGLGAYMASRDEDKPSQGNTGRPGTGYY